MRRIVAIACTLIGLHAPPAAPQAPSLEDLAIPHRPIALPADTTAIAQDDESCDSTRDGTVLGLAVGVAGGYLFPWFLGSRGAEPWSSFGGFLFTSGGPIVAGVVVGHLLDERHCADPEPAEDGDDVTHVLQ